MWLYVRALCRLDSCSNLLPQSLDYCYNRNDQQLEHNISSVKDADMMQVLEECRTGI
jgi:hypothetical protein